MRLFDTRRDVLQTSCGQLKSRARRSQDPDRIIMAETPEAALLGADLVIEAIVEDLEAKKDLFRQLGYLAEKSVIFASNTSSLPISEMAASSGRPERFIGLHFFNPPVLMRLIEVTAGKDTDAGVLGTVMDFIRDIRKTGVVCRESPGFVVNRILLPVISETFKILNESSEKSGGGTIEAANDIDSAVLKAGMFPMGPLDLADLTGIDTICRVAEVLYLGFNRAERFTPLPFMTDFVRRGDFGRKTGRGVYFYANSENDPDLNPARDERGNIIARLEEPDFDHRQLMAVVVNEALLVLEEGIVGSYQDIDTCMELGTRWPRGPFGMMKAAGRELLYEVLERRFTESGEDPRYAPSELWLNPTGELIDHLEK